jgi:hypothetical protein
LVEADRLLNGSSITRADCSEDCIEYFNIELEQHGLIQANGVWVETYRPTHVLSRETFENFAEFAKLYPGQEYRTFPAFASRPAKGPIGRLAAALRV